MPQVNIRMPEDLKLYLEDSARSNLRSLNAEIVSRLRADAEMKNAQPVAAGQALVTQ
ncbi:Arc family DNA-binding protein [Paraburkholderia tropica]|nr:Arc family DNA-binding protein [Paraburkholderia tropica]